MTAKLLMKRWTGPETKPVEVVKDGTEAPLQFPANKTQTCLSVLKREGLWTGTSESVDFFSQVSGDHQL